MTIGAYGTGAIAARRASETFEARKADLANLQQQLSTGQAAGTYAGIAPGALTSLSARTTLSALDTYKQNVDDATLRVNLASQGLGQVDKIAASLSSLSGSYSATQVGQTGAEVSAEDGLRQIIDILNTQVSGRFLFSGRTAQTKPVVPYELILDGDATHAGLKQLISERKAADLGASGRGRLTLANTATGATLSEEAAGLPFGLKIAGAAATGSALSASTSAGPPASATVAVGSQPVDGDTITLTLGLPDGTQATLILTAKASGTTPVASPDGSAATFAIGATAADTAANLQAALSGAVSTFASTTLASASAAKASADFFAGSTSTPPVRVDGPPFDTATATRPGTAADTVIWYAGDDAASSPRETAPVRTGPNTSVAIGFRANEASFRSILSALGSLAADSFPTSDPTAQARYAATADRLGGSTVDLDGLRNGEADLSVARAALSAASDRIAIGKNQAQDLVDGVEGIDPNEVASKLLATQTRLQASYQATSTIAKLTLVNFL